MQRLGFIHDMLDVKVLILFVMSRVSYPATGQQIYELCLQDDCVSYFDVCAAIPQLVKSGHLLEKDKDLFGKKFILMPIPPTAIGYGPFSGNPNRLPPKRTGKPVKKPPKSSRAR